MVRSDGRFMFLSQSKKIRGDHEKFFDLKGDHEILSDLKGGPRKFSGFDRGATKFFYKNLKFPPAPPRRYFMTSPLAKEQLVKFCEKMMVEMKMFPDNAQGMPG